MPVDEVLVQVERVLAPAVRRERHIDPHGVGDDEGMEHLIAGVMLCLVAAALEQEHLVDATEEARVIRHIRNAFLHNDGDLNSNRDPAALADCEAFLEKVKRGEVTTTAGEVVPPFYQLVGTQVCLTSAATDYVRLALSSARAAT